MSLGKASASTVTVPTWRPDVHGPADLVEEVVRIAGLDRVPATPLPRPDGVARAVLTEKQKRARRTRRTARRRGLVEAMTWSFIPEDQAKAFGGGAAALELANPISTEMSSMRPGLLPGLLTAVTRNRNRGFADVALFELGQAYRGDKPEDQYLAPPAFAPERRSSGAAAAIGTASRKDVDLFDAKADVFAVLAALGVDPAKAQITRDAPAWYHPGRSRHAAAGPQDRARVFRRAFIRRRSRRSTSRRPSPPSKCSSTRCRRRRRKSRAKPRLDAADLLPVTRDFAFVLDATLRPAMSCVRPPSADKALIAGVRVRRVRGRRARPRKARSRSPSK